LPTQAMFVAALRNETMKLTKKTKEKNL
jgi:hypothetical protein